MKKYIITLLVVLLSTTASSALPVDTKSALKEFRSHFEKRKDYNQRRIQSLDSIRVILGNETAASEKIRLSHYLAERYLSVSLDSALKYFGYAQTLAEAEGLREDAISNYMSILETLPLKGAVNEAIEGLNSIDTIGMSEGLRTQYYQKAADLYYNIGRVYPEGTLRDSYINKSVMYSDSVLRRLRPETMIYKCIKAQFDILSGNEAIGFAEFKEVLPVVEKDPEVLAMITSLMAKYFEGKPDKSDEHLYYLLISATNDIISGNREVSSLQRLAKVFHERGDNTFATELLTTAMEDAQSAGSMLNTIETADSFPSIIQILDQSATKANRLLSISIILLLASVALIVYLLILQRRRKIRIKNNQLRELSIRKAKDTYIYQVLKLCSFYIDQMEEFHTFVERKLKTGQSKDLNDQIKNRQIIKRITQEFYSSFDESILQIYPDFINELNGLLRPDATIADDGTGHLTPELRIAAFTRMGISDVSMLTKFLGLTTNTIYTYRNRLKNRAADRAKFEENLQNLG